MVDIKIENIVGYSKISESLDIETLNDIFQDSEYVPEEIPALTVHIKEPKTAAFLFKDGNVVFTGPKNIEDAYGIPKKIAEKLNAVGVEVHDSLETKIRNIVVSTSIKGNLDLKSIANLIENANYNPEDFPGLIYKTDNPKTVILLFDSGKIVGNGTELKEISTAIDRMTDELSSLGIL